MTSWSGGVRTGGWRVKNRSKFSAFRPHYERGRKELVVGGNNAKQKKQNKTGVLSPSLPFHCLTEVVSMTRKEQWKMRTSHDLWRMPSGSRPSVSVARELPCPLGSRSCVQKHEMVGLVAWITFPPSAPDSGQARLSKEMELRHQRCYMWQKVQSNDPRIRHLGDLSFSSRSPKVLSTGSGQQRKTQTWVWCLQCQGTHGPWLAG